MTHRRRALPALLLPALVVLTAVTARLPAKDLKDYQVGDSALSNITATVELVVIDREASAALREQAAAKIPPVFRRLAADAADTATRRVREHFALARDTFLLDLAARFGRRQLDVPTLRSAAFREFRAAFQAQNRGLPVPARLAAAWAAGEDGHAIEQELLAAVREATAGRHIRADELPDAVRQGPNLVRLLPADAPPALEPAALEHTGTVVGRGTLTPLSRVRSEVQQHFTAGERALGRFAANLIEPDCVYDAALTARLREFKTAGLWTADRYAAGQVIVSAGNTITPRIKAALDELAAQSAAAAPRPKAWQPLSYWPLVLISVSTGLILGGVFLLFVSRRLEPRLDTLIVETGGAAAMAPALAPPGLPAGEMPSASPPTDPALAHEQVQRVLHDRLVNALLTQRKQMIDVQRQAVADIAELELRLAKLQAPLQARLDAYEQRVAELERELVTRGHENAELINATIALVKEKLETERSHLPPRVKLN